MRVTKFLFSAVLSACLVASSFAWNATGHMVIAAIARDRLTEKARNEADRLLKIGGTPNTNDFFSAAVWADDTRTRENGPWHYIDLYFRLDGKTTDLKPDSENVVWAIGHFSDILKDTTKPDAERADALRYLLHFVGDIHQPLHCSSLVSDQFPKGDKGGNAYLVEPRSEGTRRPKNLHSFWDGGGGIFGRIERPLDDDGRAKVKALADKVRASLSEGQINGALRIQDPMVWAQEGENIAKVIVYSTPEGQVPSAEYVAKAEKVSSERAAIAGARLARLLNQLIGS